MQAIRGYLDNGVFTPYQNITLPQRADVTLLFQETIQSHSDDETLFWTEFDLMTAESANENELLSDEAFSRRDSGRDLTDFLNQEQSL